MKTAVVTGPTGAVGSALCRKLTENNFKVYAVCRKNSTRTGNVPAEAEIIYCDLSEINTLPGLIGNADVFYHLAWENTTGAARNDMLSQTENIRYTLNAVSTAANLKCECFVGAGSQAEYGRHSSPLRPDTPCFPENGYGMAKLCAGQMSRKLCGQLGIRRIWARILSVYGPNDGKNTLISSLIRNLPEERDIPLTKGQQLWDYLFSYDAATALMLMYFKGKDGAVYPLGSGQIRPLKDYIEEVRRILNGKARLDFGKIPYAEDQVMYLGADTAVLERDLGFRPEYSFTEGIKLTADTPKHQTRA